ncbi:MAG: M1 family metallopeptidase [Ignavibacteria bacterium]|nr:M1 family metallopeptidase [Ignavibacteria bacterium]
MNKLVPIILALSCSVMYAQNYEQKQGMHEWLIQDSKMLETMHPKHPKPAALVFPEKGIAEEIDVLWYDVKMDWVNALLTDAANRPKRKTVGSVFLSAVVGSSMDTFLLYSVAQQIDSVKVNDVVRPNAVQSGRLRIALSKSAVKGDTLDVKIWYANLSDNRGFYAFSQADAVAEKLPEAIAFTFSQPENARYWFPCNDVPSDKALFTGVVRVPKDFTVVSNGTKTLDVADTDSTHWVTWHHPMPMPTYLFCLNASKFTELNQTYYRSPTDTVPIQNFHWAVDDTGGVYQAEFALSTIPKMFEAFEASFGRYPFPTYGHVTVAPIPFGGMEHQSMSTINRRWLIGDIELGYAHELAHQWIGDLVTCATWGDIWLNEGGASFGEAVYSEFKEGVAGYKNVMDRRRKKYLEKGLNEPPVYDIPLSNIFNEATTYAKSSWVYHMMRFHVGDANFFPTLRKYLQRFAGKSVQTSQMLDMWKVELPSSPVSWDIFFEQWLEKAGHPVLVASVQANSLPDGVGKYSNYVVVQQTQKHDGVPDVFVIPLTVRLHGNGLLQDFKFVMDSRSTSLVLQTDFEIDSIELDPDKQILCEKEGTTTTGVNENTVEGLFRIRGQIPVTIGSNIFVESPIGSMLFVRDSRGVLLKTITTTDVITPLQFTENAIGIYFATVSHNGVVKHFAIPVIK